MFIYEVKGNRFWAMFFRSLLIGFGIGCFYLIYLISSPLATPTLLLFGLYIIFMSVFIKTKEFKVDYKKFSIERYGYFKILNECNEYKYSDIKSIEYVEGYFSFKDFFYKFLGAPPWTTLISEADRISLIRKDGSKEEIVRIGNREAFKKAVEIIKENIKNENR
jgi:hypothetical protein